MDSENFGWLVTCHRVWAKLVSLCVCSKSFLAFRWPSITYKSTKRMIRAFGFFLFGLLSYEPVLLKYS